MKNVSVAWPFRPLRLRCAPSDVRGRPRSGRVDSGRGPEPTHPWEGFVVHEFETVDAYFASSQTTKLEAVRSAVHRASPDIAESVSCDMAEFSLDGQYLAYGAEKHISLHAVPSLSAGLESAVAPYRSRRGTARTDREATTRPTRSSTSKTWELERRDQRAPSVIDDEQPSTIALTLGPLTSGEHRAVPSACESFVVDRRLGRCQVIPGETGRAALVRLPPRRASAERPEDRRHVRQLSSCHERTSEHAT